jgi:hypothetical protein
MTKNDKIFLGFAVSEAAKHKVNLVFLAKKYILSDNVYCSGFFEEDKKRIVVAIRYPQKKWFPVFIHEFCHFQQWKDNTPTYLRLSQHEDINTAVWDYVDGKKIAKSVIEKSVRAYQKMELDCEKRVVEFAREFKLSIDIDKYIQQANSYLLFYEIARRTGRWYDVAPFDIPEIVQVIPAEFLNDYSDVPKKIEGLMMKYCFKNA